MHYTEAERVYSVVTLNFIINIDLILPGITMAIEPLVKRKASLLLEQNVQIVLVQLILPRLSLCDVARSNASVV
jgi:hypothetical protein